MTSPRASERYFQKRGTEGVRGTMELAMTSGHEDTEPVPGTLNLVLAGAATAAALGLLAFASHTGSWGWRLAAAAAFSYVNNTIFSLLHEAVHGHFHANPRINENAGRLLAAFFPTGLGFQRVCHLGPHRRNRTDAEV